MKKVLSSFSAGPCCQSDPPQGGGDRAPINAELRIIRWNDGKDVEHLFTKKCSQVASLPQQWERIRLENARQVGL